jgi:hypothetical protein
MERHNVATLPRVALEKQVALCPGGEKRRILDGFLFERRNTVSRSMPAEQGKPSPYNHHLQEFLLCSVYGLRVGEVCRLRLENIDWAEEKTTVRRSKQRKVQTYP